MEIKNLSQLKRALKVGARFEIVEHYIKPAYTGQIRRVQVVQTNGLYTGIDGKPDDPVSKSNYGKGSWIEFRKASNWEFSDGCCTQSCARGKVWKIRVLG